MERFDKAVDHLQLNHIRLAQNLVEFKWLWEQVNALKPTAILEVGSRLGGSFYTFAHTLNKSGVAIAVDLPGAGWGFSDSDKTLYRLSEDLKAEEIESHVVIGDSKDVNTYNKVVELLNGRQLDFVFIDGDHSYDGVKSDWELYGSLVRKGGMVGFHDIHTGSPGVDVPKLWNEIEASGATTAKNIQQWGIGVVFP